MEGGNNSSTQGGQLELKKLLRNADVSVDGFIWCFGNVSLFPAFDESSSTSSSVLAFNLLQQLQERQDNGGGSTKSRVRNCSNNAFRLGNPYSGCRTRRSRSATACAHTLMKMGYPKNEGIVNSGSSYTVGDHSCSPEAQSLNHSTNMFISSNQESNPSGHGWIEKAAMASQQVRKLAFNAFTHAMW